MKLMKSVLLASAVFVGSVSADDFCYVSLGAGLGKMVTAKSDRDFPLILKSPNIFGSSIDSMTLGFKNALRFSGAIGYTLGGYRIEAEPVYMRAKYKSIVQKPAPLLVAPNLSGDVSALVGFINGYADFPVCETWVPYIGAGVGYAHIKNRLKQEGLVAGLINLPTLTFEMNDHSLAYQGILGVRFKLTQTVALTADYRYFSTLKKMTALNSKLQNHFVNIGVQVRF